jgi:3,4-dihydroxy 2-butanone 4-phosphate synthase/GTP cyclohydrolase II
LIEYRLARDILVEELLNVQLPENLGPFRARVFKSKIDGIEHLVLQKGEIRPEEPALVRVHLDTYPRDLFSYLRFGETAAQLALQQLAQAPSGLFVLLRGNNRQQGLSQEVSALLEGRDAYAEMDSRDYGIGAQILRSVGAGKIRLLSNTSEANKSDNKKSGRVGLKAFDLEIVEVVPLHADESAGKSTEEAAHADENRSGYFSLQ